MPSTLMFLRLFGLPVLVGAAVGGGIDAWTIGSVGDGEGVSYR